jgi:hypothetical protein
MPISHTITVDPECGALKIEEYSLSLGKGTRIELVKEKFAELICEEDDMRTGYIWLNLKSLSFGQLPAYLSISFHHGKLNMVMIGITLPDDEYELNWPTEASIRRRVEFMRKELERQLSCPLDKQNFSWGYAWANFDEKGFMASAGINFK